MSKYTMNVIEASSRVLDSLKGQSDENQKRNGEVDFNSIAPIPQHVSSKTLWCMDTWGTDNNAYGDIRTSPTQVVFKTRPNHSSNLISRLSKQFPEESILVAYASEGAIANTDVYRIQNGELTDESLFSEVYTGHILARVFSELVLKCSTLHEMRKAVIRSISAHKTGQNKDWDYLDLLDQQENLHVIDYLIDKRCVSTVEDFLSLPLAAIYESEYVT